MSEHVTIPIEDTRAEVSAWFFDDYLPRWVAAGSGASGEAPTFILEYWGVPLHATAAERTLWCLSDNDVLALLEMNHGPLKAAGYTHTVVPDQRVFVYNPVGAAIEVIWSRRRSDESEIQRVAVHFEMAKGANGWRVVGIQSIATDAPRLEDVWPR